jgi:transcription antitermination factor NusG
MPVQGDAFARREVSSVYVSPAQRFVVSLIIGVDDASSALEAAAIALGMTRYPRKGETVWVVHDRQSGDTVELRQGDFEDENAVYEEGGIDGR